MKREMPASAKKVYRSPQLIVYGSIADITRSNTEMGMIDGGIIVGMRRTG